MSLAAYARVEAEQVFRFFFEATRSVWRYIRGGIHPYDTHVGHGWRPRRTMKARSDSEERFQDGWDRIFLEFAHNYVLFLVLAIFNATSGKTWVSSVPGSGFQILTDKMRRINLCFYLLASR